MTRADILAAFQRLTTEPHGARDYGAGHRQGVTDLAAVLLIPDVPLPVARRAFAMLRRGEAPNIVELMESRDD